MGRHSSPEQGPFYRSVVAWLVPWLMIAAAVVVAVWIAVDAVSNDDQPLAPAARSTPSRAPVAEPTEEPEPTPEPQETETPEPAETEREPELITEDVTVQVLNGTGDAAADDAMADRLGSLGFRVVSVQGANKEYARTTVFWSYPEAREAAERLAARFGWEAGEKPANLSATVDLHVVVGVDEV